MNCDEAIAKESGAVLGVILAVAKITVGTPFFQTRSSKVVMSVQETTSTRKLPATSLSPKTLRH
jgi:arginine/ornithine N-succinyltransferase beta subunit